MRKYLVTLGRVLIGVGLSFLLGFVQQALTFYQAGQFADAIALWQQAATL